MSLETASMGLSAGLVRLTPPLPFASSRLGQGWVDAISLDRLSLRTQRFFAPNTSEVVDLQIAVNDQRYVNLAAEFKRSDGNQLLMVADGPASLQQLNELLTSVRKQQHIDLCKNEDVEASDRHTGFADFRLKTKALPELNWADISTDQEFLGRTFALPVLITGMTGGVEQGESINRNLALAAQRFNIPMGVGSQRIALENREYDRIFRVKEFAPSIFLIGNIGMAQLNQPDYLDICRRAVDMIGADAFAIHLNCLQELVQEEGDRNFSGILERIGTLTQRIGVPVVVKEVGAGIDVETALLLAEHGVSAIDVGGKGGTSWARIEGLRSADPRTAALGEQFRDWGIPTAYALRNAAAALEDRIPLIATGGIRDGITVAKAVALGATLTGIGLPLLRAALIGEAAVVSWLEDLRRSLRIAMACSGSQNLGILRKRVECQT